MKEVKLVKINSSYYMGIPKKYLNGGSYEFKIKVSAKKVFIQELVKSPLGFNGLISSSSFFKGGFDGNMERNRRNRISL